jgi:peptide deformylase
MRKLKIQKPNKENPLMPIKSVVRLGNKLLATPSIPVPIEQFATATLFDLIKDMHDTMQEKGGVGIAAPQIGCNQRVIMFGFEQNERYPDKKPVPLTILINPVITVLSDETTDDWEGCLSVPGLRGLVPRYNKIQYTGFDPEGNPISRIVEAFHARVVQHECDHIDGILFPQRIKDMKFFGFEEELSEALHRQK